MDKHERINTYENRYFADHGFEATLVAYRHRQVLDIIGQETPRTVVEIGCGTDLLYLKAAECGFPVERWIIVEPARRFATIALGSEVAAIPLSVITGFFEDCVPSIKQQLSQGADIVICSSLIHEINDPTQLLSCIGDTLSPTGLLHIDVPNRYSFHRRLAVAMGLIASESQLSVRNKRFIQYRVFDAEELARLVRNAGFTVGSSGGYFIKLFTHEQLERLHTFLTPEMLDGLYVMGQDLPELATEIYLNARLAS